MIEICLKDDNRHIFVMINALICINNYVITCINSMLSHATQAGARVHVALRATLHPRGPAPNIPNFLYFSIILNI